MLLEQLPASSIDRVEVITNPSARYDADGLFGNYQHRSEEKIKSWA
ncbi:MAG: hypothetical protein R3B47_15375 [Bacteroidia bacterium]